MSDKCFCLIRVLDDWSIFFSGMSAEHKVV